MVAEALMSGTPAITTDWGGFVDTNVHGLTGYRCRDFRDFVNAIKNIDQIKPIDCLQYAVTHFEDKVVHEKLHNYLQKINDLNFYRK
jgi:glycosyltransferase involved in cell wall biosynthesis